MNKKLAIISAYNYNYGTVLQAVALVKVVSRYVNDVTVLQYKKKISFQQIKRIVNCSLLKSKIKAMIKKMLLYINTSNRYYMREKNKKFFIFLKTHICFSRQIYGYQELKKRIKNYNQVLLGSDQLWNPINIGTHYFTLEFVPDDIPKNTYATSFGVTHLRKKEARIIKTCIERLDSISVRELQAKELILKITSKKDVQVCLDPTLLLKKDEWEQIIQPKEIINTKYVFAYFVGNQRKYREMVFRFAKEHGYKMILLPHIDEYVWADRKYMDSISMTVGPEEFVNLIRHAEYVFTDSFHGCAFSVIFQKKFCVFARFKESSKHSMNSRIESLFTLLNISNRWVKTYDDIERIVKVEINYNKVYELLDKQRKYSIDYLERIYKNESK